MATAALVLARRRARLRRKSAGAAVFIVAVTLGVLAVMGVYALTATANEIRSAGHVREAMQGQRAAEFAMMATAETYSAAIGGVLIKKSRSYDTVNGRSTNCRSSKNPPTSAKEFQDAEACLYLTEQQMGTIAASINKMVPPTQAVCSTPADCTFFWGDSATSPGSFGPFPLANRPFLHVEVTNPIDVPPPPGMSLDGSWTFTQVTATVYVDMKATRNVPASTTTLARGRITVGPYAR